VTDERTTTIDPALVPDGYVAILSQNRAFPESRILDVQGQLAGGTIIYLEGGREVNLEDDVNTVLRAIADARTEPAPAEQPKPRLVDLEGIDVVTPTDTLFKRLGVETLGLYNEYATTAARACGGRPNVLTLAAMKRARITSTTTCMFRRDHRRAGTSCLTVIAYDGERIAEQARLHTYTVRDEDVA
jgi:hypothetical protein